MRVKKNGNKMQTFVSNQKRHLIFLGNLMSKRDLENIAPPKKGHNEGNRCWGKD